MLIKGETCHDLIFKETVRREDGAYYCHRNNHHYSASEGILFYLYLLHLFSQCNLLIDRLLYHHVRRVGERGTDQEIVLACRVDMFGQRRGNPQPRK